MQSRTKAVSNNKHKPKQPDKVVYGFMSIYSLKKSSQFVMIILTVLDNFLHIIPNILKSLLLSSQCIKPLPLNLVLQPLDILLEERVRLVHLLRKSGILKSRLFGEILPNQVRLNLLLCRSILVGASVKRKLCVVQTDLDGVPNLHLLKCCGGKHGRKRHLKEKSVKMSN